MAAHGIPACLLLLGEVTRSHVLTEQNAKRGGEKKKKAPLKHQAVQQAVITALQLSAVVEQGLVLASAPRLLGN